MAQLDAPRHAPMAMGGPAIANHGDPGMVVAERLSATQTLIGIRTDQLDAWRAYTTALLDFLQPPPLPSLRNAANTTPDTADQPTLPIEDLANMTIRKAEKAKALKSAIDKLKSV